jgi:endonuclease-8
VPEGDTIHRAANRLRPVLVGQALLRIDVPRAAGHRPAPGTVIEAVDAIGKHLVIRFADRTTLRTHMRMTGSWHLYKSGEKWRKPAHLARAVIDVDGWTAVCFSAPVVELENEVRSADRVAHLGPDLTRPEIDDADIVEGVARMNGLTGCEIGAALLDQRVVCGIGNIFKSETLFACRIDPFTKVEVLDDAQKHTILTTASKLLRGSVATGRMTHGVYGRAGRPCPRCGTAISARRQGPQGRTTYWCPRCQT